MTGDQKATSKLMLADVTMEIGVYDWTRKILKEFTNKNSFAWLIRKAKLKDHEGDLDSAIILMERAYKRIDGNKSLACWTLSNLGDMYGHAGRIEDAYQNYLQVLALDSNYDYALKGIAWIALSNDRKAKEAQEIINYLSQKKRMPEAHLMLAELAEMKGDEEERMKHLRLFKSVVDVPNYQIMYNKYLALSEADDFQNSHRCIEIAKQEIKNRPTPQSYDLLAWGYHSSGNHKRALQIVEDYVYEKTFEPECLYHMGMIYKANGFYDKGNNLLKEARESSFELGPSVSKIIDKDLM
jgi:tetratricopeptide (TPR) repeat protein